MHNVEMRDGPWERLEGLTMRRGATAAVALVAALILISLVLSGRGAPARVAPPATSESPAPQASEAAASLLVHVAGAVRFPGLYELLPDSRVADAIASAGGARPVADLDLLNLAQPIVDGMKIDVPRRGAPAASSSAAPSQPSPSAPISLNAADLESLETIPGIGPVRAAAIVAYRDESGGFDSIDELLEVSGIGPATLEALRPYVTL